MTEDWKQQSGSFQVLSQTADSKIQYWEPDGANETFVVTEIQVLTVDDCRYFFIISQKKNRFCEY